MTNLDESIRHYSEKLLNRLQKLLPNRPTEPNFRRRIEPLLDEFCEKAGLRLEPRAEYTLATGRPDAVFSRLVIEYKRPGTLSGNLSHSATQKALKKIRDYIVGLAEREKHKRILGIVFDGRFLIFVRYQAGEFFIERPCPVTRVALERFLRWLATIASSGKALTAENLNRDFSIEQPWTQNILQALTKGLKSALNRDQAINNPVKNLYEQWREFFSQSIDYSEAFGGRKLESLKEWVSKAGLTVNTPEEAERFFFALHTYFALLVKLIAWLTLSRHMVKLVVPTFGELISADSDTLHRRLRELEEGGIFRAFGLTNLLEGDFFAWYLFAWDKPIEDAIRELLKRLDEYDPATLSIHPEESRDLFKKLYHYLLPREIRHNLGEYYTPDWLAQWVLNQVDSEFFTADPHKNERRLREKLLNTRWLDPACGSGTFLVLIIARMKELGQALFINETELLNAILRNVVGFDLNPLAVLTARVNYLLAIADLLEHRRGEITIPVYLTDSVRMPARGENLMTEGARAFPTTIGIFLIPEVLCTRERFDMFCNILEDNVQAQISPDAFVKRIEEKLKLAPPEWQQRDAERAREVYERILDLHRQGMNSLWARLLKNYFAPLTFSQDQFDYIIGNPPWVNWEHLPDRYRKSTEGLWDRYQLVGTFKGGRPRLGAVKVDISALMTYTVMDTLLKPGGRLGFVITQTLFKTAGAGAGFRRFLLPPHDRQPRPVKVLHVDDMVSLRPFEGAHNRTAVMVLEKGKPTTYPVPYTVWRKVKGARFTYDSTLEEVINATVRLDFVAEPVNPSDPTSPWLTARPQAIKAVRKVLGKSYYEAHAGVCTWLNSVYWVKIVLKRPDGLVVVRNITEGAKVKVQEVRGKPIEPDLLYPLLRGRDVQRWKAQPSAWIIVPQDPNDPTRAYPEKKLQADYPKTYGYLKQFEKELRERSGYRQILSQREREFYGIMDIGTYTFAHWKVVWREQASTMTASVVGPKDGKPVVPDHKLMLVDCKSEDEAHFVCACLNSSIGQMVAVSYAVEIQMDPHILEHLRIPRFDPKNPVHLHLAELSKQAHKAAKVGDEMRLREIEAGIDRWAAKLWNLTDDELRDIQQSLAILNATVPEPIEEEV